MPDELHRFGRWNAPRCQVRVAELRVSFAYQRRLVVGSTASTPATAAKATTPMMMSRVAHQTAPAPVIATRGRTSVRGPRSSALARKRRRQLSVAYAASGSFLASELLSGKGAGQGRFSGLVVVLPRSAVGGVGVESEELGQSRLGGVGVGEDALRAGSAFVSGGVEQDGFLDAGEVGQEFADAEVQP